MGKGRADGLASHRELASRRHGSYPSWPLHCRPTHLPAPQMVSGQKEALRFKHAAGEATGLPDASVDLVSICLVCHELPQVGCAAGSVLALEWTLRAG